MEERSLCDLERVSIPPRKTDSSTFSARDFPSLSTHPNRGKHLRVSERGMEMRRFSRSATEIRSGCSVPWTRRG